MIVTVPNWPGTFDVDAKIDPGSPTTYSPDIGATGGDETTVEIEFVVWHFSPHNAIHINGARLGAELAEALDAAICAMDLSDYLDDCEDFYR